MKDFLGQDLYIGDSVIVSEGILGQVCENIGEELVNVNIGTTTKIYVPEELRKVTAKYLLAKLGGMILSPQTQDKFQLELNGNYSTLPRLVLEFLANKHLEYTYERSTGTFTFRSPQLCFFVAQYINTIDPVSRGNDWFFKLNITPLAEAVPTTLIPWLGVSLPFFGQYDEKWLNKHMTETYTAEELESLREIEYNFIKAVQNVFKEILKKHIPPKDK